MTSKTIVTALSFYRVTFLFLIVNCNGKDTLRFKPIEKSQLPNLDSGGTFTIDLNDFIIHDEEIETTKSPDSRQLSPYDAAEKVPAACPGDSNPLLPLCENVRGELRHERFTNYTICVYSKPEGFSEKVAISKSVGFSVLALWGICANLVIVLGGIVQRHHSRNCLLALVSLGDLVYLSLHYSVDMLTQSDSYDNWKMGEFACYSVRGALIGANAFSNVALMVLFVQQWASATGKHKVDRILGGGGLLPPSPDHLSPSSTSSSVVGGGSVCGVTMCLFFLSLGRMAAAMSVTSHTDCVLRDNTPFAQCTLSNSVLDFTELAAFSLSDLIICQFLPCLVVVICARFTLPIVEFRAHRFRNEFTVADAKFYHTIIVIGMLSLALSVSSTMIDIFMDLLNYPPSPSMQIMLRLLPYVNCALIKPLVYLLYYTEIFPSRKQIFQQNPTSRSPASHQTSENPTRPRLETDDSELTTEEILNGIRELKRQTSMTAVRPPNHFGLRHQSSAPDSAIGRSKSFDSHLNRRIQNLNMPMHMPRLANQSFTNPLYDSPMVRANDSQPDEPTTESKRNSRYVNLESAMEWSKAKPKSESQLLRPSSMYINLGALSKNHRLSKCEQDIIDPKGPIEGKSHETGERKRVSLAVNDSQKDENEENTYEKIENDIPEKPTKHRESKSAYSLNTVQFAVDLHVYSDIKYHKQVSEDSGCYSSPSTPNQLTSEAPIPEDDSTSQDIDV